MAALASRRGAPSDDDAAPATSTTLGPGGASATVSLDDLNKFVDETVTEVENEAERRGVTVKDEHCSGRVTIVVTGKPDGVVVRDAIDSVKRNPIPWDMLGNSYSLGGEIDR